MSAPAPEFEPPQACIGRIIKNVLPENIQITKDARSAFTRAAACANEYAKENKRSTISSQDVLNAIKELDLEEFEAPLMEFLTAYRNENEAKKAGKSKKSSAPSHEDEDDHEGDNDVEIEAEEEEAVDANEDVEM